MAETFTRFDAADYLRDDQDIAAYLEAAAEEGDPAALAMALGTAARARNMIQLARDSGLSREGLAEVLETGGDPSLASVMKVAGALGFELTFRRKAAPEAVAEADQRAPASPSA